MAYLNPPKNDLCEYTHIDSNGDYCKQNPEKVNPFLRKFFYRRKNDDDQLRWYYNRRCNQQIDFTDMKITCPTFLKNNNLEEEVTYGDFLNKEMKPLEDGLKFDSLEAMMEYQKNYLNKIDNEDQSQSEIPCNASALLSGRTPLLICENDDDDDDALRSDVVEELKTHIDISDSSKLREQLLGESMEDIKKNPVKNAFKISEQASLSIKRNKSK